MKLSCQHCGKRLTRKGARQIGGVIMCWGCMVAPRKPIPTRSAETVGLGPKDG